MSEFYISHNIKKLTHKVCLYHRKYVYNRKTLMNIHIKWEHHESNYLPTPLYLRGSGPTESDIHVTRWSVVRINSHSGRNPGHADIKTAYLILAHTDIVETGLIKPHLPPRPPPDKAALCK